MGIARLIFFIGFLVLHLDLPAAPLADHQDLSSMLATDKEALSPLVDLELLADMLKRTHAHVVVDQQDLDDLLSRFQSFMGLNIQPLIFSLRNLISQYGFLRLEFNHDPIASRRDPHPINNSSYILRIHSALNLSLSFPFQDQNLILRNLLEIHSFSWNKQKKMLQIGIRGFQIDDQNIEAIQIDTHQEVTAVLSNGKVVFLPFLELFSDFYYQNEQQIFSIINSFNKLREFPLPVVIRDAMKVLDWVNTRLNSSRFVFFNTTGSLTKKFLDDLSVFVKPKNELMSRVIRNLKTLMFKDHKLNLSFKNKIEFRLKSRGIELGRYVAIYMHDKYRFKPLEGFTGFVGGKIMRMNVDVDEISFDQNYQKMNTKIQVIEGFELDLPMDVSDLNPQK